VTTFQVELTSRAERELDAAANWIATDSPDTAQQWYWGFIAAIDSLSTFPRRCGLATEYERFPFELRQLLYGRHRSYRAVFTIREETVVVLTIRHAKQPDLLPNDL
jgi:plasmid stabilization system protein ParE